MSLTRISAEGRDVVVKVEDLKKLPFANRKTPINIVEICEINDAMFMQGVANCLFHHRKGMLEDLEYLENDWFDVKLSSCVITDRKISGMFLVQSHEPL